MAKYEKRGDQLSFNTHSDDHSVTVVISQQEGDLAYWTLWVGDKVRSGHSLVLSDTQDQLVEELDAKIRRLQEDLASLKGVRKTIKSLKGSVEVDF